MSFTRRAGMAIRLLAAILLPVVLVFSHRSVTMIALLAGLAGLFALRGYRPPIWGLIALLLTGYAAASALWSPYGDAASWPLYLLLLALTGVGLARSEDAVSTRVFVAAGALSLLLLGVEAATGGVLRDLVPPDNRPDKDDVSTARGIGIAVSLAPGILLALVRQGHRLLALGLGVLLLFASSRFGIAANLLAALAGLLCAGLAYAAPRRTLRLLTLAAFAGFAAMPILSVLLPPADEMASWTAGPASWRQRLIIWKTIWPAVTDSPLTLLFGHGVEASRVLGEQAGRMVLAGVDVRLDLVPTHPHNLFLQIWYDLGLIGVALTLCALGLGARSLADEADDRGRTAAVAALFGATLVFASVETSLWTLWRVAAPMLGAWLILAAARIPARPRKRG